MTCGLYYKCFTIVIIDCNDSGQYYKTTVFDSRKLLKARANHIKLFCVNSLNRFVR